MKSRDGRACRSATTEVCASVVSAAGCIGSPPPVERRSSRRLHALGTAFPASGVLVLEPGLEHEHVPEVVLPVLGPGLVLAPHLLHGFGAQVPLGSETIGGEELLGPGAQRAAEPVADGETEAALGPVHQ